MDSLAKCTPKSLICLCFYVFIHGTYSSLTCRDCKKQPDLQIGSHAWFDPTKTGLEQRSDFCGTFRNFEGDLRRNVKRRRNRRGTMEIRLGESCRFKESAIGLPVGLDQVT